MTADGSDMNQRIDLRARGVHRLGRHALTMIELVIVIAIIGLVSAMAIPRFANSAAQRRLDMAARRVAADLEQARYLAVHGSSGCSVTFSGHAYTLDGASDPDHSQRTGTVNLADAPYRVQVLSADFGGDETVTFDRFGRPDSGGQVVLRLGTRTRTISMDAVLGGTTIE